jgi:hypothetical protein
MPVFAAVISRNVPYRTLSVVQPGQQQQHLSGALALLTAGPPIEME